MPIIDPETDILSPAKEFDPSSINTRTKGGHQLGAGRDVAFFIGSGSRGFTGGTIQGGGQEVGDSEIGRWQRAVGLMMAGVVA